MRGLAPDLRSFRLQSTQVREGLLEIAQAAGRLHLLEPGILRRAFAHPIARELRQLAAGDPPRTGVEVGPRPCGVLEFVDEDEMQVSPLAHQLALAVALLPADQAVANGAFALVFRRLLLFVSMLGAQPAPEGIEHFGDVVVKLRARQRRRGGQLRVRVRRLAPPLEDRVASVAERGRDRGELVVLSLWRSHLGLRGRRGASVRRRNERIGNATCIWLELRRAGGYDRPQRVKTTRPMKKLQPAW